MRPLIAYPVICHFPAAGRHSAMMDAYAPHIGSLQDRDASAGSCTWIRSILACPLEPSSIPPLCNYTESRRTRLEIKLISDDFDNESNALF
jgi:hypothetical protein